MNKRQRQQLIRRLVEEMAISSQRELVDLLGAAGPRVTQATISRDLREMGLQKARDTSGRTRYAFVPHSEERPDPEVACSRMLREFSKGLVLAQNLIVLRSDPGTAPGLGRVIDELEHKDILGCVAGDDTVLVVTKDVPTAEGVCRYLKKLGG